MRKTQSLGMAIAATAVVGVAVAGMVAFMNGREVAWAVDEASPAVQGTSAPAEFDGDAWATDLTFVTLSGDSAQVQGNGAVFENGRLVIVSAGRCVVCGELASGGILVQAGEEDRVEIQLNGASITCADDAALRVESAGAVRLNVVDGSRNVLAVSGEYAAQAQEAGVDGAIFCRSNLCIEGSGLLEVTAASGHGIVGNDGIWIEGGSIAVNAAQDGIRANDSLSVSGATIQVVAGDDGLVVDEEGGWLIYESGTVSIQAGGDGVHASGDIAVSGGQIDIAAGDDGIHSDAAVQVSGGTVLITQCYEGIEGTDVSVSGGDISIVCMDDGINGAVGSNDGSAWEKPTVTISGGRVVIVNPAGYDADGIDSNGDIVIQGGEVYVSLSGQGSNLALDWGSESGGICRIDGGVVVAAGSSTMMQAVSGDSAQASVVYGLGFTTADGTTVALKDANGNTLVSYEVPVGFSNVVVSSPDMAVGGVYTLEVGDTAQTVEQSQTVVTLGEMSFGGGRHAVGGFPGEMPAGGEMGFGGDRPPMGGGNFAM